MTREDFQAALRLAASPAATGGIGRMAEKSVHAVLKYAYEPHAENHEIPVGNYIADIVGEQGIIEIQSRDLWRLAPKLEAFLEVCDVTVVRPIPLTEWIVRTDPDTGETSRRKSPRHAAPFDILAELSPIRGMLANPRLHFRLALLEVERYDIGKAGSRRKQHLDRVPLDWLGEIRLDCPDDYRNLCPEMGEGAFTAAEFGKAAKRPTSEARAALLTLIELGFVQRAGKKGRLGLYQFI